MTEKIVGPKRPSKLEGDAGPRPPRRHRALRALEWALWGVGIAASLYLGYVALDWQIEDGRQVREMRELSSAAAIPPFGPQAGAALSAARAAERTARRRVAGQGELLGRLEIPAVDISAFVAAGTGELTLRRGVGHIDGTALPGEAGNIGLAGHRDTVFRGLRRLEVGDRIRLVTPNGSSDYAVEWLRKVGPEQVGVVADTGRPTLTLVTCYPFDFIGPAPLRFVVRARQVTPSSMPSIDTD